MSRTSKKPHQDVMYPEKVRLRKLGLHNSGPHAPGLHSMGTPYKFLTEARWPQPHLNEMGPALDHSRVHCDCRVRCGGSCTNKEAGVAARPEGWAQDYCGGDKKDTEDQNGKDLPTEMVSWGRRMKITRSFQMPGSQRIKGQQRVMGRWEGLEVGGQLLFYSLFLNWSAGDHHVRLHQHVFICWAPPSPCPRCWGESSEQINKTGHLLTL